MFDNILRRDRSAFVREIAVFALLGTAGLTELAATSITCIQIASGGASSVAPQGCVRVLHRVLVCASKEAP